MSRRFLNSLGESQNWITLLPFTIATVCFVARWRPYLFPPYVLDVSFFLFLLALLASLLAVILLPTTVFVVVFLKRSISIGTIRSLSFLTNSLIALTIFWLARELIPRGLPSGSYIRPFSSQVWLEKESSTHSLSISEREKMLGDLIDNVLPGKSGEEIQMLLGPSLRTGYFGSIDKDLIYYLGRQRDFGTNIDSEWLLIWLDTNGIFEKAEIYND